MDRLVSTGMFFFMLLLAGNGYASIIVTNDWASAVVQIRDQKGGVVETAISNQGETGFDISLSNPSGDSALVEINRAMNPGSMINARVVTDDTYSEVESWLDTSWCFTVSDVSVDYHIGLFVDEGGAFTSSFSLYDMADGSLVFSDELFSYGYIGSSGTLLAGHDYLFNASLPRVDAEDVSDEVFDGTSGLDFWVDAEVLLSPDRTHLQVSVPEPSPLWSLMACLGILGWVRLGKRQ